MIIGKPYTEGVRYPQIRKLLSKSMKSLGDEIELLFQKTKWAKDYLFEYNERAFVGLFNNAIIRQGRQYRTFQEYHVYKKEEQLIGRADLLVMHDDFDFLIEAKKWTYDGKEYNMEKLFRKPKAQIKTYYHAEKKYYDKKTYLGVLIFEYVPEKHFKEMKKEYGRESKHNEDIHFDALYAAEKDGVIIYGQVFSPDRKA